MEPTIKAILARFNGDRDQAYAYCMRTLYGCKNAGLSKEYWDLAMIFHPGAAVCASA